MQRMSRSNRLYKWLLSCSARQRFVLSLSLFFCISTGWYALLYRPLAMRTYRCQKKFSGAETNVTACKDLHTQFTTLQQRVRSLEQEIEQGKYDSAKHSDYISTIATLAQQSVVCLDNCSLGQSETKQACTYIPLTIQGHGTLVQLTDFFTKIFGVYKHAAPSSLSVEHIKNNVFQFSCCLDLQELK